VLCRPQTTEFCTFSMVLQSRFLHTYHLPFRRAGLRQGTGVTAAGFCARREQRKTVEPVILKWDCGECFVKPKLRIGAATVARPWESHGLATVAAPISKYDKALSSMSVQNPTITLWPDEIDFEAHDLQLRRQLRQGLFTLKKMKFHAQIFYLLP